ncbi:hypothetical protein Ae201684_005895 [Aphanomyces euteiches]|uniref:Adenosine kinase n=1 Tax=Aphanomyces euteiches TaxID=100861 RepID=A0A6G0XCX2_9STRA|nr:hypothetical protein Ae201684_005895 [Aphanomyces euteiches]
MDVPAFAKWLIETHLQPQAVVVITSGNAPTLVIQAKSCSSFPVSIPDDFLVQDTNGAGDAFVGGFLAAMMRFCCLESCVELAHLCAVQCVQKVGAHVHLNYNLMNKAHAILSTSKRETSLYLALIKQS